LSQLVLTTLKRQTFLLAFASFVSHLPTKAAATFLDSVMWVIASIAEITDFFLARIFVLLIRHFLDACSWFLEL
jgi:hypothetical protein